jgi:hypothetical protein
VTTLSAASARILTSESCFLPEILQEREYVHNACCVLSFQIQFILVIFKVILC